MKLEIQRTWSRGWDRAKRLTVPVVAVAVVCAFPGDAWSYYALRPWNITSTGSPSTVTWGFADDGAWIPASGTSDLVSFLDSTWGVSTTNTDLTQRPWFSLFESSFNRWSQLSGISFVYEDADDGASLQTSPGLQGMRADIRIAGKNIDGQSGALASTWLPDTGDMVIDTGDTVFWANALIDNQKARNMLMHEIGHGFGLMHIVSGDTGLLMEPYNSKHFDGPQLDDIRGIQSLYGDKFEKINNGLGNGTIARATSLGILTSSGILSVGGDAAGDQVVLGSETNFVSITNNADIDYFSFTVNGPGELDIALIPLGGIFSQGSAVGLETIIDATSANNLSLAVFGPGGASRLGLVNRGGAGIAEVLTNISLPDAGIYYIQVLGDSEAVQLYELDLAFNLPTSVAAGDFNGDGAVNGADFVVWQQAYGGIGINLTADGNHDGTVDGLDLEIWQANFGRVGNALLGSVPEPGTAFLMASMFAWAFCRRR